MNTIIIVSYALAFLGAASRLLPLTKPFWNLFPKMLQATLPSLVAAIPLAIQQLTTVKTPMDLTAALLIIGALFLPGASSPHNHPELPPPDGTLGTDKAKPPPSFPPLAAASLFLICLLFSACTQSKPPCDQAKLAAVVAVCTAQSQQCKDAGKTEAECSTLADCDSQIQKACGQ